MRNDLLNISNKTYSKNDKKSLDEQIRDVLTNLTLGEIVQYAERCSTVRVNAICTLIFNALFGTKQNLLSNKVCRPDIGLINELIKRIDGAVPESNERENFANLIGNTIEEVMNSDIQKISFNDLGIIAIAKAILAVALNEDKGMSVQDKRDRQIATEIWLTRTGGKKSKPEQYNNKVLYKDQDFVKPLTE